MQIGRKIYGNKHILSFSRYFSIINKSMQSNKEFKDQLKKRVYLYALDVIRCIDKLDKKDFITVTISRQLLRSATSIGANIIEAQAGSSKKDFVNYLLHALKSANETKFWLGLLRDSRKAETEAVNKLLDETISLGNIVGASVKTLKKIK